MCEICIDVFHIIELTSRVKIPRDLISIKNTFTEN